MPSIFLSHASLDDPLASALEAWLRAKGFDDLFVDHSSIRSGDKWTEALRRAKGSCRVVLCLVTPAWLTSDECYGEFTAGWYAGRRMIPLLSLAGSVLDEKQNLRLGRVLSEDQGVDLTKAGAPEALDIDTAPAVAEPLQAGLRAAGALARVGLDPYAFEVDKAALPEPFPGLQSFGDSDAEAAIFFGRSGEIARCLEDLREMRATGDRRAYALLGSSGSGKSSLMMAGLLPRLRRERSWLVLRALRPGMDPLYNFADAIARTAALLGIEKSPGAVRDALRDAWRTKADLRAVLDSIVAPLKLKADRANATVLITVDQGEELLRAKGESADALAAYLKASLTEVTEGEPAPYAVALTLRSDSLQEIEAAKRFEGLEMRPQNIRTLPVYRFDTAIEQPAARYGVEIEPALVEELMEQIGNEDALPILAFAMQRLWRQYEKEKHIRKADYESIGKLSGIIEDAAERALRGIDPLAPQGPIERKLPESRDKQAARVFVPALADLNERGAPVRRMAELSKFDDAAKEIIGAFDRWRLTVTSGNRVEVAHEAVFREWPRFKVWFAPEKARLETVRGLESASASWDAKGRRADDLTHRGRRLAEARALDKVPEYKKRLDNKPEARPYLAACRRAQRRRLAIAATAGIALLVVPFLAVQVSKLIAQRHHAQMVEMAWRYKPPPTEVLGAGDSATNLRVGAAFQDCEGCPEMTIVPAGPFMMGSPSRELDPDEDRDELPEHLVFIPRLAIGKFDVTFDEWDACVKGGGCISNPNPVDTNDPDTRRGRRPVVNVKWDDAHEYVEWLSRRSGQRYRLLSEAEWEYAARAETTTRYYTGDSISEWTEANFNNVIGTTEPVGSYPPNPFGLFDMAGNVWQWVEDCYHPRYRDPEHQPRYGGAPSNGAPWVDIPASRSCSSCDQRVLRGGNFYVAAPLLRSANRFQYPPNGLVPHVGFRVAREL